MGVRTVTGLEMEAATIATVAQAEKVPHWLVVKGVMDHADPNKDDRYKRFAARASAEVLYTLLDQLLDPPVQPRGIEGRAVSRRSWTETGSDPRVEYRATLIEIHELLDQHVLIFHHQIRDKATRLSEGQEVVRLTRRITTLAHRCIDDTVRKTVLNYMEGSLNSLAVSPTERTARFIDEIAELVGVLFTNATESVAAAIRAATLAGMHADAEEPNVR